MRILKQLPDNKQEKDFAKIALLHTIENVKKRVEKGEMTSYYSHEDGNYIMVAVEFNAISVVPPEG
jgi:hypothetical protein